MNPSPVGLEKDSSSLPPNWPTWINDSDLIPAAGPSYLEPFFRAEIVRRWNTHTPLMKALEQASNDLGDLRSMLYRDSENGPISNDKVLALMSHALERFYAARKVWEAAQEKKADSTPTPKTERGA